MAGKRQESYRVHDAICRIKIISRQQKVFARLAMLHALYLVLCRGDHEIGVAC